MARIISIASGKGGVGKTSLSVNLALQMAQLGQRVCLLDADLGLANVNILMGLQPERTLAQVVQGQASVADILIRDQHGIDIIPGSSGIKMMADLAPPQVAPFIAAFDACDDYDWVLVDTSAGIARNVISFSLAAPEVLLVVNTEPTSLTDAYALLKVLYQNDYAGKVRVLVNQTKSVAAGQQSYDKFRKAVQLYLQRDIALLGVMPQDTGMHDAVTAQQPILARDPGARFSKRMRQLASTLLETPAPAPLALKTYWRHYVDGVRGGSGQAPSKETATREAVPAAKSTPVTPRHPQAPVAATPQSAPAVPSSDAKPQREVQQVQTELPPQPSASEVERLRQEVTPMLNELVQSTIAIFNELREIRGRLDEGVELHEALPFLDADEPAEPPPTNPVIDLAAVVREGMGGEAEANAEKECNPPETLRRILGRYPVQCERVCTDSETMDLFTVTRKSGGNLVCGYHADKDEDRHGAAEESASQGS